MGYQRDGEADVSVHRVYSVSSVRCEVQEKIWLELWGYPPQKGQREKRNGGSYTRMNGNGKGKSCRGKGGLLILLIFAKKQSVRHG